ncbi:hypothetical protein BT96DRAFT_927595 [Gymnopus androsaceus JB14]|uniref:Uncharacterized protein n=1 Tax=Gymnopus androsaceus JB14 TaxID=1447944 RepID=A0A6A4GQB2_9AGAR|nr:hypothetical protein BT96DRAFT_927595 [Gymnopus androsaceus JB14]
MSFLRVFSLAPTSLPKFGALCRRPFTVSAISKVDDVERKWDNAVQKSLDAVTSNLVRSAADKSAARLPEKIWEEKSNIARINYADIARVNNNPYIGRSVKVVDGNLAEAFRKLDYILFRNRVRKQLKLAERHEKKGVKRRRLESERWRRLFAHEVRKNVQLVTKIRKRGA